MIQGRIDAAKMVDSLSRYNKAKKSLRNLPYLFFLGIIIHRTREGVIA